VVANETELVFAQAMQLIEVDAAFLSEVSQDEKKRGVFEFVLGVDFLPVSVRLTILCKMVRRG